MADERGARLRGVALMLTALLFFAALDASVKYLTSRFSLPFIVWSRYTGHCLMMLLFLAPTHGRALFATRRPGLQILRGLLLAGTTALGAVALKRMPLAETTAILFVTPLVVTLLAVPMLRERLSPLRLVAVLAGLAGVLLIARPGGDLSAGGVAFALAAAGCYSLYQILTRRAAATEQPLAMLFYTALVGTAVTTAALPWFWDDPSPSWPDAALLATLGVLGGSGHFLMIGAFRLAPLGTLSPLLYVQLVWALLLGWLLFGQVPDGMAVAGMAVIAASGIAVAFGSRR